MRLRDLKCGGPAWLFGWVTAIFLPSLIIALARHGIADLPATTWKVADDMGPFAKLMLGGLLILGFLAASRLRTGPLALRAALAGLAAMALTLALLPVAWSRGFGIGLAGARFDPQLLPWYAIGAIASGVVFAFALTRCQARS